MESETESPRRRRWQIALAAIFAVLTMLALFLVLRQPERPPPPVLPASEQERLVLQMAEQFVKQRSSDFSVPIDITTLAIEDSFLVTYWTPEREMQLLGPRQVIVRPELNTVEMVMRE